ncbi:MAG: sulfurtransferase [Burkholderiales bacterium]|jgi:rhodanese-related sulfurtransferase|nr:sulfurtransferase [Burkholderiales bacterium]MCE3268466.1 sulfurtransferase [Burkholderiales bacterium]
MHNIDFLQLVEEYRPLVKETDVSTVKARLDANENFTLIDVREDHEWVQGHIPNATHMARGIIERDIEKSIPDKSAPIILYCGGGFRSVLSAYNLQKMGYTNVISMDGGIKDWLNHGFRLEI